MQLQPHWPALAAFSFLVAAGMALGTYTSQASETPQAAATLLPPVTKAPPVSNDRVVYVPGSSQKVCQLTGEMDRQLNKPTKSQTSSRFGMISADHGYSFEHNGKTFFLVGDITPTAMFKGQKNGANDPPRDPAWNDAVGFTSDTDIEQCLKLDFVAYPNGAFKNPVPIGPDGQPAHTLETNESPEAGVSDGGKMYVLFRTDNPTHTARPPQPLGFATRTTVAVSEDDGNTFKYLWDFSIAPNARFINIAIAKGPDGYLYFWGTEGGEQYRKSAPILARKPVGSMGTADGLEYLKGVNDDGSPNWITNEKNAEPLFHNYTASANGQPVLADCMGELGVEWNSFLNRYVMLYNCLNNTPIVRGVHVRVAEQPWGPWSEPVTLFNPTRDSGYCNFIHRPINETTPKCDDLGLAARPQEGGGNYGPYFISRYTTGDAASMTTTFYHVLDTWIPYTQVIMKGTIRVEKINP